jgi:hypothetical protein
MATAKAASAAELLEALAVADEIEVDGYRTEQGG